MLQFTKKSLFSENL